MVPINQQVIVAAVPGEDGGLVNVTGMQLQDGISHTEEGQPILLKVFNAHVASFSLSVSCRILCTLIFRICIKKVTYLGKNKLSPPYQMSDNTSCFCRFTSVGSVRTDINRDTRD